MLNITREDLLVAQEILDRFQYPVLFELHLDEYWQFTYDSEVKYGHYPDDLEYCDEAPEGCRLAGDFMMVNALMCTGVMVTKVFSMDKQVPEND